MVFSRLPTRFGSGRIHGSPTIGAKAVGGTFMLSEVEGLDAGSVHRCGTRAVASERIRIARTGWCSDHFGHTICLVDLDTKPLQRRHGERLKGMMRRAAVIAGLFLILPFLAAPAPASEPALALRLQSEWRGGGVPITSRDAMVVAEASCASLCRQRHNQCRISTRGAPRCDADLQRCLKDCLATKRQ
jgi:hypothetical protein